jgi:hypothetical protein
VSHLQPKGVKMPQVDFKANRYIMKKNTQKKRKIPNITHWNYRVIKDRDFLSIYEVHYNKNKPIAWTEETTFPSGETLEELKMDLLNYMSAIARPVLIIKNNKLYEDKKI